MHRCWYVTILLACLYLPQANASVKLITESHDSSGPLIVSPLHPHDSRGETVYEIQGPEQKDVPVVPGTFIAPKVEKIQKMKFPRSLSRANDHGSVALDLVIAADGSVIDITLPESTEPEMARAALDSMSRSRFKPASLNGIPVAFRGQIVYQFKRPS